MNDGLFVEIEPLVLLRRLFFLSLTLRLIKFPYYTHTPHPQQATPYT